MLKSRQALTPVLEMYTGDGTLVTHLDQVSDGDVLMYRCAHHPARNLRTLSTRFFIVTNPPPDSRRMDRNEVYVSPLYIRSVDCRW